MQEVGEDREREGWLDRKVKGEESEKKQSRKKEIKERGRKV